MSGKPNQPPQGGGQPPAAGQPPSPGQPPSTPPGKKKVKIRKRGKWVDVDVDTEIKKGRFRYVKFTDEDGFETYWLAPE